LPAPHDPETFGRCKIDWTEREMNVAALDFHRDLLRIRREDPPFPARDASLDGAVLGDHAFVLRSLREHGDRLLIVNLGDELTFEPVREPLLAPPLHSGWTVVVSSESPRYGGSGTPPVWKGGGNKGAWRIAGRCTLLLAPIAATREEQS
jgi:maltooligosyltrehalose trehalohydrolase